MKRFLFIILFVLALTPFFVFAVQPYTPLVPIPGVPTGTDTALDLGTYLGAIYKILIAITILLAVIVITWSGVQYMLSDSIFSKGEAKKRIGEAIGGIVLASVSWLILFTINPALVEFNFFSGSSTTGGGTTNNPPPPQLCFDGIIASGSGIGNPTTQCGFNTLDECNAGRANPLIAQPPGDCYSPLP